MENSPFELQNAVPHFIDPEVLPELRHNNIQPTAINQMLRLKDRKRRQVETRAQPEWDATWGMKFNNNQFFNKFKDHARVNSQVQLSMLRSLQTLYKEQGTADLENTYGHYNNIYLDMTRSLDHFPWKDTLPDSEGNFGFTIPGGMVDHNVPSGHKPLTRTSFPSLDKFPKWDRGKGEWGTVNINPKNTSFFPNVGGFQRVMQPVMDWYDDLNDKETLDILNIYSNTEGLPPIPKEAIPQISPAILFMRDEKGEPMTWEDYPKHSQPHESQTIGTLPRVMEPLVDEQFAEDNPFNNLMKLQAAIRGGYQMGKELQAGTKKPLHGEESKQHWDKRTPSRPVANSPLAFRRYMINKIKANQWEKLPEDRKLHFRQVGGMIGRFYPDSGIRVGSEDGLADEGWGTAGESGNPRKARSALNEFTIDQMKHFKHQPDAYGADPEHGVTLSGLETNLNNVSKQVKMLFQKYSGNIGTDVEQIYPENYNPYNPENNKKVDIFTKTNGVLARTGMANMSAEETQQVVEVVAQLLYLQSLAAERGLPFRDYNDRAGQYQPTRPPRTWDFRIKEGDEQMPLPGWKKEGEVKTESNYLTFDNFITFAENFLVENGGNYTPVIEWLSFSDRVLDDGFLDLERPTVLKELSMRKSGSDQKDIVVKDMDKGRVQSSGESKETSGGTAEPAQEPWDKFKAKLLSETEEKPSLTPEDTEIARQRRAALLNPKADNDPKDGLLSPKEATASSKKKQ